MSDAELNQKLARIKASSTDPAPDAVEKLREKMFGPREEESQS